MRNHSNEPTTYTRGDLHIVVKPGQSHSAAWAAITAS